MKRCLVIGNGPSLANVRNDTLDRFVTFGGNWIFEKYQPTYYVFVDPMIGAANKNWMEGIKALTCTKYVHQRLIEDIRDAVPLYCIHRMGFSKAPLDHVYTYFSVITPMIQLAYMMGFEQVGLVGVDHRYNTPRGARAFHLESEDTNHFMRNYYGGRLELWKAPRLDLLAEWFELAKIVFEQDGREIVNLTPGSDLQVFRFEKLEDWLE